MQRHKPDSREIARNQPRKRFPREWRRRARERPDTIVDEHRGVVRVQRTMPSAPIMSIGGIVATRS
jgi:hypothetical protein